MPNCSRAFRNGLAALLMSLMSAVALPATQRGELQSTDQIPNESSQKPVARIPVEELGFLPPGQIYALMRVSYATLDFLDPQHLLFTFHKTKLLSRLPDSDPDDDDQLIHAVVLEVATGKVLAQSEWRMHDRDRYLWPLGPGLFLVRMRNQLYVVDKGLSLTPYLEFPGKIKSIQVGLGGEFLLTESQEQRVNLHIASLPGSPSQDQDQDQPDRTNTDSSGQDLVLRIIKTDVKKQVAMARTRALPYVPLMRDGYLYALRGREDHWNLGLQNLRSGVKSQIGDLESTCAPMIYPLNDKNFMAVVCPDSARDHVGRGLNLEGKRLWERHWSRRRIWPSLVASDNGSRFAYETMVMDHEIGIIAAADAESVIGQVVEVYDSASGRLRFVAPVNPILDAGQNFALTADGKRIATLHNGAIEIFDLPPADGPLETSTSK
jgi:hypothetical protein